MQVQQVKYQNPTLIEGHLNFKFTDASCQSRIKSLSLYTYDTNIINYLGVRNCTYLYYIFYRLPQL